MSTLTDIMNRITELTDAVTQYTQGRQPDFIGISELPCYNKQDELTDRHHLSINVNESSAPLKSFSEAINKMFVEGDQSSRILQRWSGILVYNEPHEELAELISALNQEKKKFKNFVNQITKKAKNQIDQQEAIAYQLNVERSNPVSASTLRDKKWELVHGTFSMLVTLYVYRQIHVIDGPISAAYLGWLRAPNTPRVTKEELLSRLEWQLRQGEKEVLSRYDPAEISRVISIVASSYRTQYVQKIPQPPRPNLALHFDGEKKPKPILASLPVIVLNQKGRPFTYKPLKPFDSDSARRNTRSDAKQLIHLYGNYHYEPD